MLDSLFKQIQPQISELTFTNLFVWNSSEPVLLSRLGETVLLQRNRLRDARTFLLPPVGAQALSTILKTLRALNTEDHRVPPIYGMTAEQLQQLTVEGVKVEPDRDDWDYVYLTKDLADLPSDRYHPKRNFIARCLSKHECEYVSMGSSEISDRLQLQTRRCNLRNCKKVPSLEAENTAIKTAFENYRYLGVMGGAVYVDGKLEARASARNSH